MVKITNGIDILEVSKGAFSDIYSRQGYKLVGKEKPSKAEEPVIEEPIEIDEEEAAIFLEAISETPVPKWSKEDVKKYAQINDIDISSVTSFKEAKAIIKEHIESTKE